MKTEPNDFIVPTNFRPLIGLSKREYFAAIAMQAVLSTHGEDYPEIIAIRALRYADALINELNKEDDADKTGK